MKDRGPKKHYVPVATFDATSAAVSLYEFIISDFARVG
jgi:hypothetical protein